MLTKTCLNSVFFKWNFFNNNGIPCEVYYKKVPFVDKVFYPPSVYTSHQKVEVSKNYGLISFSEFLL